MRRAVLLLGLLSLAACKRPATEPAAEAEPRTRPLAADGTLARELTRKPDRVRVKLDLSNTRAALKTWIAANGSPPASLDELNVAGLNYPEDLVYDAATGEVTSATYPSD